jgi:hypothetical protein
MMLIIMQDEGKIDRHSFKFWMHLMM